jgi:hypothetical protein
VSCSSSGLLLVLGVDLPAVRGACGGPGGSLPVVRGCLGVEVAPASPGSRLTGSRRGGSRWWCLALFENHSGLLKVWLSDRQKNVLSSFLIVRLLTENSPCLLIPRFLALLVRSLLALVMP